MVAEVALGHEAALAMDEDVAELDDPEIPGDERHEPVVGEMARVEERLVRTEKRADLLFAPDHDRVVDERASSGENALEARVRGRPDLLQADEIRVAMRVEEGEQPLPARAPAPGVE